MEMKLISFIGLIIFIAIDIIILDLMLGVILRQTIGLIIILVIPLYFSCKKEKNKKGV